MFESLSSGSGRDFPEGASGLEDLDAFATRLTEMFDLRACWFESFPFDTQLPRIEPGKIVLPAAEPGVEPWSYGTGVELPVRFRGLTLGRFVLVPASPTTGVGFSPAGRDEAISMVEGIGSALATALVDEITDRS